MSKMQRDKGANFERWVANEFKAAGFVDARRGLGQTRSAGEVPDVDGLPVWWVECKHRIRVNARKAWEQANDCAKKKDNGFGVRRPLAVVKDNRLEPLAVIAFADFMWLLGEAVNSGLSRTSPATASPPPAQSHSPAAGVTLQREERP